MPIWSPGIANRLFAMPFFECIIADAILHKFMKGERYTMKFAEMEITMLNDVITTSTESEVESEEEPECIPVGGAIM